MGETESPIESIAIGSFDGIHIAHRELIARAEGVAVIEREPRGRLTPGYKRSWYCEKPMAFYLFERIRHLGAREFVAMLREDYPRLKRIVVGYDFRFGKDREGSARDLEEIFEGEVEVIPEIALEGIPVHLRTIRELLSAGEPDRANRLLGRPYAVDGTPVRGQGLGSREFVPTINLVTEGYHLPAEGVYAGVTRLGDRRYKSAIFLGHRVSTDGSFALETHLLEYDGAELPPRIFVEFHRYLRPNRRFECFEELRGQIGKDLEQVAEISMEIWK